MSTTEVSESRYLLDRYGLSRSVAEAASSTLHPAEVWALWTYARASHLGPGWVAKQVYQFAEQRPRRADLSSRYDAVGRALAALRPDVAEQVLDIVDAHCPQDTEALKAELAGLGDDPELRVAAQGVWSLMAEQRGGPQRLPGEWLVALDGRHAATPHVTNECGQIWRTVLGRLGHEVAPDEFRTWLTALNMVDIIEGTAIIGTPNVFVRDEVTAKYREQLAAALEAELGRVVAVEIVIAGPIAA
ncbi:MAG TPA: DnaA N-terminal domain-containing protein [Herpetosiphonaceae bacterium]|nr:DnaA N-terminal domain-containing protein [Herpetosiphonaceae bacterium]